MRRHDLDNIRWATVLLVVIYHVFYLFNACGVPGGIGSFSTPQVQDAFLPFVYPWFMVLLFVIAGVSARYALERRTVREFIRARTVKLLVPSTLGLLVFQWITGYLNVRIGGGLAYMTQVPKPALYLIFALSGTGPLWFAQMLWLFSLVLALIRKLDRREKIYTLCQKAPVALLIAFLPLLWAGAQVGNVPVLTMYRFGIYAAAFFGGYFIFAQEKVPALLERFAPVLLAAALVTGGAYAWCWFGRDYTGPACLQGFFTNFYAWLAVLAVLGSGKRWWNKTSAFAGAMIRSSYGVYVLHYLFALLSCWGLKSATRLPAVAVYPLAAILTLAGTFLCYGLLRCIPVVRWCVLGIKGEKR